MTEKIPVEIFELVESFKKFVREQKAYKDQKFEVDAILEVGREIDEFNLALQRIAIDSDINSKIVQQIKDDTAKLLRHSELAYSQLAIIHPPSTQQNSNQQQDSSQLLLTNNQPQQSTPNKQPYSLQHSSQQHCGIPQNQQRQYFAELADQFEARMRSYGQQIQSLKVSIESITRTYNADELFKWLKKQHETLGEIAAKIYMTHEMIMEKKSELDKMNNVGSATLTNQQQTTTSVHPAFIS